MLVSSSIYPFMYRERKEVKTIFKEFSNIWNMGKLTEFRVTLNTEREVFYPGKLISGKVVVSLATPMDMKGIILDFKAKFLNTHLFCDKLKIMNKGSVVVITTVQWRRSVVVITTVQLNSTKPELRFCAGSEPARSVLEIRDGQDL